jgi:hypothetical protein
VLCLQLQDERDTALDQLNMQDMQNTALKSNNNELMHALEGEQRRNAEMERVSISPCAVLGSNTMCDSCILSKACRACT